MKAFTVGNGPFKPAVSFSGVTYVRHLEFNKRDMALKAAKDLVDYLSRNIVASFRANRYDAEAGEDAVDTSGTTE